MLGVSITELAASNYSKVVVKAKLASPRMDL